MKIVIIGLGVLKFGDRSTNIFGAPKHFDSKKVRASEGNVVRESREREGWGSSWKLWEKRGNKKRRSEI